MSTLHDLSLSELIAPNGYSCSCGRHHCASDIKHIDVSSNCLESIPNVLSNLNISKPFLVMGENSIRVAGYNVMELLDINGVDYSFYCFPNGTRILPNEDAVSLIEDHLPDDCDYILGIGSGVINDLCKYVGTNHNIHSGIVATAPSMDGYASNSSAMELSGVKTTVYTNIPTIIICDTSILKDAPIRMIESGCGDMVAKIISISDWQIANHITGEYYCDEIAQLMMHSFNKIVSSYKEILNRDENAIRIMTEGLIISGIASSFAGVSRPASGMEHTVSHLLEMFALSEGKQPYLHGIQVGYGTRIALKLYKAAQDYVPAIDSFENGYSIFNEEKWVRLIDAVFKEQANTLITNARKSNRNSYSNCKQRALNTINNWSKIKSVIDYVVSEADTIATVLDALEIPPIQNPSLMGYSINQVENAVKYSRDLRDRYVFTSMCFDIGLTNYEMNILDQFCL